MSVAPSRVERYAAFSLAAIQAEHQRLDAARAKLETEIRNMAAAAGTALSDDEIVRRADQILAARQEVAQAEIARVQAERAALGIQRQREAEEAAAAAAAEVARIKAAFIDAENARLSAAAAFEASMRAVMADLSAYLAAHEDWKVARAAALRGARMPLVGGQMSDSEALDRVGGWMASLLKKLRLPGVLPGTVSQIGAVALGTSHLHPAERSFAKHEAEKAQPIVAALTSEEW